MLPTYYINIDSEDCGMTTISLVESPAIEKNFIKFDTEQLIFSDEEKHIVFGPALLAGVPIYRYNQRMGEYNIIFSKEVIEQIVLKYSKEKLWNMVNLQHNSDKYTEDAIMVEMFIKDSAKGIDPVAFKDVPDGSLFVAFKITNDELWKDVKESGKYLGFSIEITGDLEKQMMEKMEINKTDDEVIDDYLNELFK